MTLPVLLLITVLTIWAFERFYLRGNPPAEYPTPDDPGAIKHFISPPGAEQDAVIKAVEELNDTIVGAVRQRHMQVARTAMNGLSAGRSYVSSFVPVDAGGVPAEWVLAPGADPNRRVLYIHGGGFIMGSPLSHRTITSKFSEITACAVLAIDYRLMPEYKHADCVEDCRTAYRWLLENGPDGPGALQQLFISGDSAGGNLTLSLAAWIRDEALRPADAIVAMSPLTDCTFSGHSIRQNEATDTMLAPLMKTLNKLPPFVKSWWVVRTYRIRPSSPVPSPLLGDLSGLPPTLVQASEAEMLLDDARRYVFKACAAGSPAQLQTWTDMVHIWQIFEPELPQATEAWNEIKQFLQGQNPVH